MINIERTSGQNVPMGEAFPHVICGICEACGTIDGTRDDVFQYQLCPHFGGIKLRCSYCPETVDPAEVIKTSDMKIHGHPDNPNKHIVVCDSLNCSAAHLERFKINT